MTRISSLATLATADATDVLPMVDVSATTTKKITKAAFLTDVYDGSGFNIGAIKANKADFSVADATARLALASPFEGLICYQKDVDAEYIYDGSAWRRQAQWEELGRTTLGVAGDTISITPIAARKYLQVRFHTVSTGGTQSPTIRFNNDSGANYAFAYTLNFGTIATTVSNTNLGVTSSVSQGTQFGQFEITNFTSQRKLIQGQTLDDNNAGPASTCNSIQLTGKWDNTAAQITRIDITNAGAGDFAIGSQMIILGRD